MLRKKGVVGKFVEFYGPGVAALALTDRATIANMAPEYGATMGFFPVDAETIKYLKFSGRPAKVVALAEAYCRKQGLFRTKESPDPVFTDTITLNLKDVEPSLAGPRRPQDRVPLKDSKKIFRESLKVFLEKQPAGSDAKTVPVKDGRSTYEIPQGAVVIASITSCTNTSNPSVMLGAGLLAKKAVERGLSVKPWVKTSLAPGSKVVTDYLTDAGLMPYLEAVGFHLVGYGCTTCIGNSGPLPEAVSEAVRTGDLVVAGVLSGNRNFEGRINPQVKMNYLASPPLVVAYALAGEMDKDLTTEPLGTDRSGATVYLKDIWPTPEEVQEAVTSSVKPSHFKKAYGEVFDGDRNWRALKIPKGRTYVWEGSSTYVRKPPFFTDIPKEPPTDEGDLGRPLPRHARRLGHDRPHLPRRQHREGLSRGGLPARARGRARGLQLLRRPPRQPRGHDARHVREHPAQELPRPRQRGKRHRPLPDERADVDLRRVDEVPGREDAARRRGRRGIRHGLVARLGGQGDDAPRRPGGHREELRADPPLEPRRDGRPPAPVRAGPGRAELSA